MRYINICRGCNFSGNQNESCGRSSFTCYPGIGILGNYGIKHSIRNLIANFIWVTFGYRFRGEKAFIQFLQPPY